MLRCGSWYHDMIRLHSLLFTCLQTCMYMLYLLNRRVHGTIDDVTGTDNRAGREQAAPPAPETRPIPPGGLIEWIG